MSHRNCVRAVGSSFAVNYMELSLASLPYLTRVRLMADGLLTTPIAHVGRSMKRSNGEEAMLKLYRLLRMMSWEGMIVEIAVILAAIEIKGTYSVASSTMSKICKFGKASSSLPARCSANVRRVAIVHFVFHLVKRNLLGWG